MVDIVLDAMGSDQAPGPEIRGAILACRKLDVRIHLVGPQEKIAPALAHALRGEQLPIEVVHASQWISMEDKAALAVRSKRDSSMRVGLKRVREGKASGFVTAGNTGAAMATAKMVLGTIAGVDRPALATVLPTVSNGSPSILLDVGANVDSDANNLIQFALMGQIYSRYVMGVADPRVGLLSIGEEDSKGNALSKETLTLLRALEGMNFVGNVEGRDLFGGHVDVAVCDGFVGNVALKTMEGLAKVISGELRKSLKSSLISQLGALLSRNAFAIFKERFDHSEYGGAPLLGVRGACIIGHGSSNARAIMNAVRVAAQFAQSDVTRHIGTAIAASQPKVEVSAL